MSIPFPLNLSAQITEPDLIRVGRNASLEQEAHVMSNTIDGERLRLGAAKIEQR
jgi:hypothetical protein